MFTDGFLEQKIGHLNNIKESLGKQLIITKPLPAEEIYKVILNDLINYCGTPDDNSTLILKKYIMHV